ncbi:hypothetical protein AcW1_010336 [Taiwanofungus camphoratus]|nr:hypothetical protein AcW1_010336 [Antrodia cinnamomea]
MNGPVPVRYRGRLCGSSFAALAGNGSACLSPSCESRALVVDFGSCCCDVSSVLSSSTTGEYSKMMSSFSTFPAISSLISFMYSSLEGSFIARSQSHRTPMT